MERSIFISGKASFEGNVKRKDTDTGDKTTVEIGGQIIEFDERYKQKNEKDARLK